MVLGHFRLRRIIPAHLKTQPAKDLQEARKKVLSLYRTSLRYAGEIQSLYPLDVPVLRIRQVMRQQVEKHRYVTNLDTINMLTFQGAVELEETLYMWKTQSHVMKYFKEPEQQLEQQLNRQKNGWLDSFYSDKN